MRLSWSKVTIALLASSGSLALGARPAAADPVCADAWIENSDGSRDYPVGPNNCQDTPFDWWMTVTIDNDSDPWEPWWPAGFVIQVTVPLPV